MWFDGVWFWLLCGAAWPPPSFGGAAFLPLSCWMVLIGHLFPPGVFFFFDKGTGLPCVWFPRAVRIQHGCQWPSLCGRSYSTLANSTVANSTLATLNLVDFGQFDFGQFDFGHP